MDAYSSTASRFSRHAMSVITDTDGAGENTGLCRPSSFASQCICFFESRNARISSGSDRLSRLALRRGVVAMLNAALTSACWTNPQCGHSNLFRNLLPNSPHRQHRVEVYAGFTYMTGIPRLRARLSTIRWSVKNEPLSNVNSDANEFCSWGE